MISTMAVGTSVLCRNMAGGSLRLQFLDMLKQGFWSSGGLRQRPIAKATYGRELSLCLDTSCKSCAFFRASPRARMGMGDKVDFSLDDGRFIFPVLDSCNWTMEDSSFQWFIFILQNSFSCFQSGPCRPLLAVNI